MASLIHLQAGAAEYVTVVTLVQSCLRVDQYLARPLLSTELLVLLQGRNSSPSCYIRSGPSICSMNSVPEPSELVLGESGVGHTFVSFIFEREPKVYARDLENLAFLTSLHFAQERPLEMSS